VETKPADAHRFVPCPAPADAGLVCRGCGRATFKTRWQTFANGTKHIKQDCATCGAFQRYLPQHSGAGCRFVERLLTVVQTRRLQGQSVLRYLYEALVAHRDNLPAPSLLPVG
jgi:hypothetical protein